MEKQRANADGTDNWTPVAGRREQDPVLVAASAPPGSRRPVPDPAALPNRLRITPPRVRGARFSRRIATGAIAAGDACLVLLSGFLPYLAYLDWELNPFWLYFPALLLGAATLLASFTLSGVYTNVTTAALLEQIRRLVPAATLAFLSLIAIAFVLKISDRYSRVWYFSWMLGTVALIALARAATYALVRALARSGHLSRTAVIVGVGPQAERLARELAAKDYPWLRVVGVFDDRKDRVASCVGNYPLLGDVDALVSYARQFRCDDILVTLPWSAEDRIREIVGRLNVLPVAIRLAPDLAGFDHPPSRFGTYHGLAVLNVARNPLAGWRRIVKGVEDRVLAASLLLLVSPLLLVIAALIRLDSPGPVFFRQQRYGFNNRIIRVLKFRTMYVDQQDPEAHRLATRDDPRVTRIGALLRKTSLDELPQLVNVLSGEMSIVGPRPHALMANVAGALYDRVVRDYATRHKMKPGITGWAQVNGWRGETDTVEKMQMRVEHDMHYIRNWSLALDMKIVALTVVRGFAGPGAY